MFFLRIKAVPDWEDDDDEKGNKKDDSSQATNKDL